MHTLMSKEHLYNAYSCTSGPHTMLCCTWHLNAQCAVWSALSTQCTVNLEHSNALSIQCTRSNGHSALRATHLLGTKVPVRALCVLPCAREPRRPPWASPSLSLLFTRALPRLHLPVSVLSCDVRRYMPKLSGDLESVDTSCDRLKNKLRNSLKGTAGGRAERQGRGCSVETAAARASRRV